MPPALRRQVLAEIQPTPERTREANRVAKRLIQDLRQRARAKGLRVEPRLVGSVAKDTHLASPLDVDIFILFPVSTPRNLLEKHGVALGKAVLRRPILRYAEHPYVHGTINDLSVDIVPAYKLASLEGRLSAVDRTPFHTAFVKKRATPRLRQEIRLLKQFLRGIRCYGAETATGGVSGYLAELLVLKYGSFAKTVDAVAAWKPPVVLSLEKNADPLGGVLCFVDPVDPLRNAAAAVSQTTFDRFGRAARAFRKNPRRTFFFPHDPQSLPVGELRRLLRTRSVLGLEIEPPPGRPETILPRSHRLLSKWRRALHEEGFETWHADAFLLETGRVLLLWEHDPARLPPTYAHRGPRAEDAVHVERFRAQWGRRARLEKGRWVVEVRRKERTALELLLPQRAHLLQGFEYAEKAIRDARLVTGLDLAKLEAWRLSLTVFLRRLDPWDA